MNVSRGDNCVLAMDVVQARHRAARGHRAGYGKRTAIEEYPVKGRGTMGVKTIGLTEKKGGVAAALIVREHHDLVFISQNGMVQRTGVRGISKQGRPAQGVRLMNLREDDQVSAVALVMEAAATRAPRWPRSCRPIEATGARGRRRTETVEPAELDDSTTRRRGRVAVPQCRFAPRDEWSVHRCSARAGGDADGDRPARRLRPKQ